MLISYGKCTKKYIILGDQTTLPILGYRSAKFSLNGKVIFVWNALHMHGLCSPLYLLQQHKMMKGCGYFLNFDTSSFILFPTFAVKVDYNIDGIVNKS